MASSEARSLRAVSELPHEGRGRVITDGCGMMGGEKDSRRGGTREHIKKL